MKKLLKGLLAVAMMFAVTACGGNEPDLLDQIKEKGYITLATSPDFAPNEFYVLKDGEQTIVGSDIALAQAIADEIGVELKINPVAFKQVISEVQAGNADFGISGFAWTETRAKAVKFSANYSQTTSDGWQGLMIRKADADKYKTLDDIKAANLKIGAQAGSIQAEMASKLTNNVQSLGDNSTIAQELAIGSIDAYVITSTQAAAAMNGNDSIMLLPEEGFNLDPDGKYDQVGAVFSKTANNDSLIEVVNKVIEKAKVVNAEGKSQLDIWNDEAEALLPFDLTSTIYGY